MIEQNNSIYVYNNALDLMLDTNLIQSQPQPQHQHQHSPLASTSNLIPFNPTNFELLQSQQQQQQQQQQTQQQRRQPSHSTPSTSRHVSQEAISHQSPIISSSLKLLHWTKHYSKEESEINIYLEASALQGSKSYNGSPGSSSNSTPLPPIASSSTPKNGMKPLPPSLLDYARPPSPRINLNNLTSRPNSRNSDHTVSDKPLLIRRFVVAFGDCITSTKYVRTRVIPEIGLNSYSDEDAFVRLTARVPPRSNMGSLKDKIFIKVRVVDELSRPIEEIMVGEWEEERILSTESSIQSQNNLKRPGSELESGRTGTPAGTVITPIAKTPKSRNKPLASPRVTKVADVEVASTPKIVVKPTKAEKKSSTIHAAVHSHLPLSDSGISSSEQPDLVRASQIRPVPRNSQVVTYSSPVELKIQGDLNQMALGWSNEEWTNRRRLIQVWRQQIGNVINMTFRPISQNNFIQDSIIISCIFRDEWNECFVTSVDAIYLLEALVGIRFTVEEKNRIRRNLEGFKPLTVSKGNEKCEAFFKLIMGFPNPKPRNIEKDVKVFPWKSLENSLVKIMAKYSATISVDPSAPVAASSSLNAPRAPIQPQLEPPPLPSPIIPPPLNIIDQRSVEEQLTDSYDFSNLETSNDLIQAVRMNPVVVHHQQDLINVDSEKIVIESEQKVDGEGEILAVEGKGEKEAVVVVVAVEDELLFEEINDEFGIGLTGVVGVL